MKSVVQNRVFTIDATQPSPPSWGLDRIDQKALPLNQSYTYPDAAGQGVTAYIIDTGVRISHGDFGGRAYNGFDAIDNDNVSQDGHGHGTHVAGTVAGTSYGVAKKAKIVGVRVLNNQGSGTTDQVVAGIDWVTQNAVKPAVANMSLGGGVDSVLDEAVRRSIASGVTYAVAAGNDGANASNYSPARVARPSRSAPPPTPTPAPATPTTARSWTSSRRAPPSPRPGTPATPPPTPSPARRWRPRTSPAPPRSTSPPTRRRPRPGLHGPDERRHPERRHQPGLRLPEQAPVRRRRRHHPPPTGKNFENTTDYAIADNATVESPIAVTGVTGNAPPPSRCR